MNLSEKIYKILEDSNKISNYVNHLDLPGMCDICKFLFMYGMGYCLGFGPSNTGIDWNAKGDAILYIQQEFKWLSPKEQKQGFIDK